MATDNGDRPSAPGLSPDDAGASLFHLGYVSTATRALDQADILEILDQAERTNSRLNITGVLLHRGESFFQVLEGEEGPVREVFGRILEDSRHKRVEVLFEEPVVNREFPDWRMGFVDLDGVDIGKMSNFSDYLIRDLQPRELFVDLSRTRRLMLLFRQMT